MNVFDLFAKLTLDSSDYDRGLDSAGKKASMFGDVLKANLVTEGLKTALDGAVKLGETVVDLASQAFSSYADYEQLVGGVETLFKGSAEQVEQYASQAYKTAGLSANEYMETVTSFSASLLQSLGGDTKAAADMADLAITDMSDNANKMGTDMSAIQNAYQGFAKQNYSMLDNLKLGYGGTQTEMFRLLQDAAALNEEFANTANFSLDAKGHLEAGYADIVRAIHIVQDEMGITGTTAKEASETISGSLASLGSAWKNVLTGIGDDNADFDSLVTNLVDSLMTAGENIFSRVEQIISGVGRLVERLAPVITSELPGMVQQVVPGLLQAATSLVGTFGTAIVECLPAVGQVAMDLFGTLSSTLSAQLPELSPVGVNAVFDFVDGLLSNSDQLVDGGIALIEGLVFGIVDALPILAERGPELCIHLAEAIIMATPKLFMASFEIMDALNEGIKNYYSTLFNTGAEILTNVGDGFMSLVSEAAHWGRDLIDEFISGITSKFGALVQTVRNVAQTVRDYIGFSEPKEGPLSDFHTYGKDMMQGYAEDIEGNAWQVRAALNRSLALPDASVIRPAQWDRASARTPEAQVVGYNGPSVIHVTAPVIVDKMVMGRLVFDLNLEEGRRRGTKLTNTY